MGLLITTDIDCDGCRDWTEGATGTRIKAGEARKAAARNGWVRVRRDGRVLDLCPRCAQEAGVPAPEPPIESNPFAGAKTVNILDLMNGKVKLD